MTFDWAQIAYIGSPLLTPWWAAANVIGGLVIIMWIIAPILCQRPSPFALGLYSLIYPRLQERTISFVHAYHFVCSIRRHRQAVRRQQDSYKGLSLRPGGLLQVQQGLPTHHLRPVIWRSIRKSLGFGHTYFMLAWPRYLAAGEEVACRRRRRKQSGVPAPGIRCDSCQVPRKYPQWSFDCRARFQRQYER